MPPTLTRPTLDEERAPAHDRADLLTHLWAPRGRAGLVALVVALVLALGSGVVLATSAAQGLPDDAVLKFDGKVVTQSDLDDRVSSLQALYGVTPPTSGSKLAAFRRDAAKSMAVGLVLEHEAAARDIVISDKQARAELDKLIADRLGGDRTAFSRFLGDSGISERDVLDEIRRTMSTNQLYTQVTGKVPTATEAEARTEYDSRRADMATPEKRVLRNIVVATEADAQAVRAELDQGASFAAVAKARSRDASTKGKGGLLGSVAAADLDPTYAAAAFAAPAGSVYGPVQSQYGWNIGRVDRVVAGTPLSFDQVKATLVQALTSRAQLKAWRSWLRQVLEKADVEYADSYRPAHPTSPPADVTPTQPATAPAPTSPESPTP